MKSTCVFHPIRAKSSSKKIEKEVEIEINARAPAGLAISDAALGRQIVQDLKRSRTGRLPFFCPIGRTMMLRFVPRRRF